MRTQRAVVITGAAGGIGSALVERFLANDDTVVATDRRRDGLDGLVDRYPGRHADGKLVITEADISSEGECAGVADCARTHMGRVDVLLNVAGHYPTVKFEDMTLAQWHQVVDVNLTGTFLMIKAVLPLMKGRGWGRIVNFGSASVFEGVEEQAHYVAAKAGIVGLTRSIAPVLGAYGITVNVVTPGLTVTAPIRDTMPADFIDQQRGLRSIRRDEVAEDLVGPTFFLASPESEFMSGQTVNVDGGKHKL